MSSYRTDPFELKRVPIVISRSELKARMTGPGGEKSIRLVPLLRGERDSKPYPEYRIFNVQPESSYALLGLHNADILVAADEYIIKDPRTFGPFVTLLTSQSKGSIEIVRDDTPMRFEYSIVE